MKKRLSILVVTGFPCIRALKEAHALKRRGHRIILCCMPSPYNSMWDTIADTVLTYQSPNELEIILKKVAPKCDIVHGHNEPNWHIACAIVFVTHCPIIYDCHDFSSLRSTLDESEYVYEKLCFEKSHAVIHVSHMLNKKAKELYNQQRSLVLYSLPTIKMESFRKDKKLVGQHVVYQGGLNENKKAIYNYRYYYDYFTELANAKSYVHIFPTIAVEKHTRVAYKQVDTINKYIYLYPTVEYHHLLEYMSAAHWGFTGFYMDTKTQQHDSKTLFLNYAMPNKLFEYLLVGVTPIVINCEEAGQFVTKHNIGYHVRNMSEFIDVVHHAPPLVQHLDPTLIDMNLQIVQLETLYYDLLGIA